VDNYKNVEALQEEYRKLVLERVSHTTKD